MTGAPLPFGRSIGQIIQYAYTVADIDRSMALYTERFGVGPWFRRGPFTPPNARYRGESTGLTISLARAFVGDTMIELIQQHNNAPSIYREFLDVGRIGMHHVAYWADDFDGTMERVAAAGYRTAQLGRPAGTAFAYVDGGPAAEFVEIMQLSRTTREFMDHIRDTAATWDGKDPIRNLG